MDAARSCLRMMKAQVPVTFWEIAWYSHEDNLERFSQTSCGVFGQAVVY